MHAWRTVLHHLLSLFVGVMPAAPDSAPARLSYGAVELRWRAPVECPDAAWIDSRIRSDLAIVPRPRDPLSILVDDDVQATDDGRFALSSHTTSATGSEQRRWVADECTTLAEIAVAQAVSAIDQSLAEVLPPLDANVAPGGGVPDAPRLPDPFVDAPRRDRPAAPEPAAPARPRKRLEIALRPMLGLESGGLPGTGPTMGVATALLTRRVRTEASAQYFMPRYTGATGGAGAVLQLVTAAARVCPRGLLRRIELAAPCVGLELGAALGRGVGVDVSRRDAVLWAAALVGPALAIRVHPRMTAFADAHAAFPLGRPTFAMRELGTVWRASIGVRALVGLEIRLW
jgi:hypothetical protein